MTGQSMQAGEALRVVAGAMVRRLVDVWPAMIKKFLPAALLFVAGLGLAADAPVSPPAAEPAYATVRPMIADQQRLVAPNAIEVSEAVELGGLRQWITIRGADKANPVLI